MASKAPPLPAEPQVFDTAEQHGVKVTVLTKAIGRPFGMAFLLDGDLLISERARRVADPCTRRQARSRSSILPVPGLPGRRRENPACSM